MTGPKALPPLMVLGTSSGAGKSLMTAALCRVLLRRGERPLPFKGQNMSNNAWVDQEGGEMAYSQALQAWAAGLEPHHSMNPVLLKPQGDSTSELIHRGRSVGSTRAETYYQEWFRPGWAAIRSGLQELQAAHPNGRLVLEGAGSPVEVNLQRRDLTNLRLAKFLRARCLLVADIERGGVFAQVVGTLALMQPIERQLIRGILINRFRGRRELFDAGRQWLESETGIPVLGVMPWLAELFPPEDSLDLLERRGRKENAEIEIGVIKLPSLSNFSDLDPLEAEPSVRLRWIEAGRELGQPDAVVIPGSKQTLNDLSRLKASGLGDQLQAFARAGGPVFGICGGMQMLGRSLVDPLALEGEQENSSSKGSSEGLNLLPIHTEFRLKKTLQRRAVIANWPAAVSILGYELHHGQSKPIEGSEKDLEAMSESQQIGWRSADSAGLNVAGTYLHGIFENGAWRRTWLNQLRRRKDLQPLAIDQPHHAEQRNELLDRLADAFEAHVNLEPLIVA
ncbi:MAG: cobyric acid synthase [Prochlorococcus sp.]